MESNRLSKHTRILTRRTGLLLSISKMPVTTILLPALIVGIAIFGTLLAPYSSIDHNVGPRIAEPSMKYLFGTDGFGRDVFTRVIHGIRTSMLVGLFSILIASTIGISVGMVSSHIGGMVDLLIQRLTELTLGIPFLIIALIIVVSMGPSMVSIISGIALALCPQIVRLSRNNTFRVRNEAYIEASKMTGSSTHRTIFLHVLPNILPPSLAQVSGLFGYAMVAEATLSFLGLGIPPPQPSLGRMIHEGVRQHFEIAPWVSLFPAMALTLLVMASALFGDTMLRYRNRKNVRP